jgi:hypothetical protein
MVEVAQTNLSRFIYVPSISFDYEVIDVKSTDVQWCVSPHLCK